MATTHCKHSARNTEREREWGWDNVEVKACRFNLILSLTFRLEFKCDETLLKEAYKNEYIDRLERNEVRFFETKIKSFFVVIILFCTRYLRLTAVVVGENALCRRYAYRIRIHSPQTTIFHFHFVRLSLPLLFSNRKQHIVVDFFFPA